MNEQLPTTAAVDLAGQILNLRYRLGRCLSNGALGDIYQAHDLIEDRPCALKIVHHSASNVLHPRERLAHEAGILSRLSHRNIISGARIGCDEQGTFFLTLPPLDGVDLHHLLTEAGALPLTLVLEIVSAVGAALQYLHDRGIVHQDVNPSSIFLYDEYIGVEEAGLAIKLLNFGLARQLAPGSVGRNPRSVSGAHTYIAPESVDAIGEALDARVDQWSLAVLAYQMLTGKLPPVRREPGQTDSASEESVLRDLKQVKPELPDHVVLAIRKALSKERSQRYIKTQDFLHALDSNSRICQRPTRELKLEVLLKRPPPPPPEALSTPKAAPRIEVAPKIAPIAEAVSLPDITPPPESTPLAEAVPLPMETEETTRQYPTLSMPAMLLAAVVREPPLEPLPVTAEPWQWRMTIARRWWLGCCIGLALASALIGTSLRHLWSTETPPAALGAPQPLLQALPPPPPSPVIVQTPLPLPDNEPPPTVQSPPSVDSPSISEASLRHAKRLTMKGAESAEPRKLPPDVETALVSAQTEYVNGNYREAVAAARAVQSHSPVRSWRIIGAAACFMKDAALLRDAYKHLRSHESAQRLVSYACKVNGIDLSGNPLKPSI